MSWGRRGRYFKVGPEAIKLVIDNGDTV